MVFCEFESRSDEVFPIQHYVIKFVSDLRQLGGFLRVLRFPTSEWSIIMEENESSIFFSQKK
jgi:hypothetical protein